MDRRFGIILLAFILIFSGLDPVFGAGDYSLIRLKEGIAPYGNHAFNDGLIPVMYDGSISENGNWAYLTEEGNVFSHQYASGFEYSEGLAPIVREVVEGDRLILKMGYMDRKGRVVIDPDFDVYSNEGITFAGRFKKGEALVYKEVDEPVDGLRGYWYRVNRKGQILDPAERVPSKDLLFEGKDQEKRICNDKYSVNYQSEEDLSLFGQEIKKVRFNRGRGVVRIKEGKNQGSYLVVKKSSGGSKPDSLARRSKQKVVLNGREMDMNAYLIGGNNYFKLRDLAYMIRETEKQFDVAWDPDTEEIDIYPGRSYRLVGGEMVATGKDLEKPGETRSPLYLEGDRVDLKAYKISNNNYFKLRDLGRLMDIGIDWDGDKQQVIIDTSGGYFE